MAVQDQALRTRYIQRSVDGTNISPKCRKCNKKDETINHITSECPALTQNQHKKRHDTVARAVHWNLCKKYQMPCSNKLYEHQPQPVTENENAKFLWDYSIRTDRVIQAHRPDLTLVDKTNNKVSIIDIAVPWDSRAEQKEQEERDNYQDLRTELETMGSASGNSPNNHWGIRHYTQVPKEEPRRVRSCCRRVWNRRQYI